MEYPVKDGMLVAAEFIEKLKTRPLKASYPLVTLGAKTARGGEVVSASTGMVIEGHDIACVGDLVRYPDGTESKIVSGAGFALAVNGRPIAIIGSATDNGDTIISSLQNYSQIAEYADESIPGFLQPGYMAPSAAPT